ncbi:MAG: hypothetical protein ACLPN5_18045 [Roseiarcus sp.]
MVFVANSGIEPAGNGCERALRACAIYRRAIGFTLAGKTLANPS